MEDGVRKETCLAQSTSKGREAVQIGDSYLNLQME